MAEYSIDNSSFVSILELNEVVKLCSGLKDSFVSLRFKNNVERIDVAFIAGLYLFYRENNVGFGLLGNGRDNRVFSVLTHIAEIKQALMRIQSIYDQDPGWISIRGISFSSRDRFTTPLFAPVLFIDDKSLMLLFKNKENLTTAAIESLKEAYINGLKSKRPYTIEKQYYSEIIEDHIVLRLYQNSPVHTFVYCIIHSIVQPFTNSSGLKQSMERIENMWAFTKQYVDGLFELAKNIVYHSQSGIGVISIGSYKTAKKDSRNLETYVFDYGARGIIPTMIHKLDLSLDEDRRDQEILTNNYKLKDFFAPGQSKRLTRQIRRDMAHIGLIHFISLVKANSGTFSISSFDSNQERDYYGEEGKAIGLDFGTNFYFSLPIVRNEDIEGVQTTKDELSITRDSLAAMPKIILIRERIKTIRLEAMDVVSRDDEQTLINQVSFNDANVDYYAIDFERINISASGLLRVLAVFSESTQKSVIVFNVITDVYSAMVMSNDYYFRSVQAAEGFEQVPYWIKDRAVLVYSRPQDKMFYFCDLLFGDDQTSFLCTNKIIHNTFPNYCTVTSDLSTNLAESDKDEKGNIQVSRTNGAVIPFFHQTTLLPFDLVLRNSNGNSLFDERLLMVIKKKMA